MGKIKYPKTRELIEKSPVVDFSSLKRIIKDESYTKQLVHNLIKKGKINRLTNGCYTKYNDRSLSVYCFEPAYLGLQDALSFHELWEQETIPIILTAQKARPGIRKVMGKNVLIRRLDKKYLFGHKLAEQDNFYLPYSDIEKTFIDMLYFKENLTEQTLKNIKQKINKKKLNQYLKKYPSRFTKKVLNKLK